MNRSHVFGTAAAFALAVCTAAAQSTATQDTNGQMGKSHHSNRNETVTVTGCLTSGSGAGATGTTGTTGSSSSRSTAAAGSFMLTNATIGGNSSSYPSASAGSSVGGTTTGSTANGSATGSMTGSSATGTSGSSMSGTQSQSSQSAYASGNSFMLVGHERDLRKDVNSRVEIRGTIEGGSNYSGSGSMTGTSGAGNTASGTGSTATGTGSSVTSGSGSASSSGMSANASGEQTLRVSSVRKISGSCSGQ